MSSVPGKILILIIDAYRYALSPLMSALGGSCRFAPSCSEYAREAVMRHGAMRGLRLAAGRLLRCHPFNAGGHDPVPGSPPEKSA